MSELKVTGSTKENWTKESLTPEEAKLLVWQGQGFDTRTHIVNPRTGECIRQQSYRYIVDKSDADHSNIYIRDGLRYTAQGHCLDKPGEPKLDQKKVK